MVRWIFLILLLPLTSLALVQETGTLTGFLMDTCATCAYDNWQSHVAERIVRPGYNDYGPPHLDPQTNGFGGFTYVGNNTPGDSLLARWRQVFTSAIRGDWHVADSLVTRSNAQWNYELVELTEPGGALYHIIRDRIDSVFVDLNGDTLPENDVVGGFRKGWGVFIFRDNPRYATSMLQIPHPEDDFMAIPVGIQLFQETGMAIFEIAGAGREVMWDSSFSTYNNARSISDPSRNGRHPFAELSRVATDEWNAPPINPFTIVQLHSYDHGSHGALPDVQVSCYLDDDRPNPPVRDVAYHRDLFHFLPLVPVTSVDGDTTILSVIDQYIGIFSSPQYSYYGEDTTIILRSVQDLTGAPDNVEAVYCHIGHDVFRHTENFIHVELDEYPDELWSPADWVRWLPGTPPTEWATYQHALLFYAPFISAVDSMLALTEIADVTPPELSAVTTAFDRGDGSVVLTWSPPARDSHFDSYEIYYDTLAVTLASPHISRVTPTYGALGDMYTASATINGLITPVWQYKFSVRALDMALNVSELSTAKNITDGVVNNVTLFMGEDSLYVNWSAQPNDSLFEVREYPPGLGGYYLLGMTTTPSFAFTPNTWIGGTSIILVKRIIR